MTDEESLRLCITFCNETGIGERLEQVVKEEAEPGLELYQICKAMSDVLNESLIPNAVSDKARVRCYTV